MKAKVIKTGKTVNVIPTDGGWVADFRNCIWRYVDGTPINKKVDVLI